MKSSTYICSMKLNLANVGKNWKNQSGIYCLEINSKNYVGSAQCINIRLKEHDLDLRNGNHTNSYLQRAYNKYKTCTFNILEFCTVDILIERETYWYNKLGHYNILHPEKRTGNKQSKVVYQYNLEGVLVTTHGSTGEAARAINSTQSAIGNCCKRSTNLKYHNGFLWSYKTEINIKRSTETAKEVYIYNLKGNYLRSFYSAEYAARVIAQEEGIDNYLSIATHLRSCASKEKGTILRKYQIRYYKLDKVPEFIPFHKNSYKID